MTIRNLEPLLRPRSIVLIGASAKRGSLGGVVLANVLAGGFAGIVYAVNPHRIDCPGVIWFATIAQLPEAPDLAIVMTPAETVPGIIAALGARGTRCAVVISAGVSAASGLRQAMLDAARPHLMRIVGPNCLGVMAPLVGLDATFASTPARPGRLALVSQSGALITAMLDWAACRGIGFSAVVSAGDMADVDMGDLIDALAVDTSTDAILLYIEGVTDAAKFMSAARAAARVKPVIAIKAGRSAQAARATLSHTGALAGSYAVYQAAFERAGIVMVDTLTELFDAAEMLCASHHSAGDRLGIVTNGGGAGILAVDALLDAEARLADLSDETIAALDTVLPRTWSRGNPIDLIGDATAERYRAAIRPALADPGIDALLVMNCPTATTEALTIAQAVVEEVGRARSAQCGKPVIACWLGDANASAVRELLTVADIPLFNTPDDAVRGFGYLLAAERARAMLIDAPAEQGDIAPVGDVARAIIDQVRAAGRTVLSEIEAKTLLEAYRIPTVPTRFAPSVAAVDTACRSIPAPYAVKIVSPALSHKSDVGGVVLHLPSRSTAVAAARAMKDRIAHDRPDAPILGFAVEAMCDRPGAYELIVGLATDPTFGPILMVGAGGTGVEQIADKALALAPIDHSQAAAMITRTRIHKLLAGYRGVLPADLTGVAAVLDAVSAMAVDLPDILELDINPLLVDAQGVIALDARVRITEEPHPASRLVIRAIPAEWAADLETRSGLRLHVRPVRGDDEPLLAAFFDHVTPDDLRFRFLSPVVKVDHDRLAMMTKVDYRRTITFLAFGEDPTIVLATAMLVADPDRTRAEVALATRADHKGRGISWALFAHVLHYADTERITTVEAIECADHEAALRMEREMGFIACPDPDNPAQRIVRRVIAPAASVAAR